jgi:hypothetical protein
MKPISGKVKKVKMILKITNLEKRGGSSTVGIHNEEKEWGYWGR